MKRVKFGKTGLMVPAIVPGCMRLSNMENDKMNHFIHASLEMGANFFDHADIYGGGMSEQVFGDALKGDTSIKREDLIIQSKCGIVPGVMFDFSKEHIISSVDGILKRLSMEYLDILLLHRPDALCEPEIVAEAFDELEKSGKVRYFGVSNHKPMQIELLNRYLNQELQANQLQYSLAVSNMVANGLEVNMTTDGAIDYDGSVLDYSRLKDMTIQAWSPFQRPDWQGPFIGSPECKELNAVIDEMAEKYNTTPTTIASAWILRHPANMQIIAGTTSESRLQEIVNASDIELSRADWYKLFLSAGHRLP